MTVADIQRVMEEWAPPGIAWERDNVGLQVGAAEQKVRRILLCLDVTHDVVAEAVRSRTDLIISHHPLLFHRPSSITTSTEVGSLVLKLAEGHISLYSAHTNLDWTTHGVSFALARVLGLKDIRFLSPLKGLQYKIAVFVPEPHVSDVMTAMAEAGAGVIGNYSCCSFQSRGSGTFRGSEGSHPFVGTAGTLESAEEVRLEMILPRAKAPEVLAAMRRTHPYEEVAYDLYPVEQESANFGMGAVGALTATLSLAAFLRTVKRKLKVDAVRCNGTLNTRIRTVAVCGGSGSDLLDAAVQSGADAFVTADVRYHTFHDAVSRIVLIDAGHWETERNILPVIAARLRAAFPKEKVSIDVTKVRTSPIHTY